MASTSSIKSLELIGLGAYSFILLLLACFAFLSFSAGIDFFTINTSVNIAITTTTLVIVFLLASLGAPILLSSYGWFMVSTSIFFGFGALLYAFANDATKRYTEYLNPITPQDLFYVNSVVLISLFLINTVYFICLIVSKHRGHGARWLREYNELSEYKVFVMRKAATSLLFVGLPVQLFIVAPSDIGITNWVFPGVLRYIGLFAYAALIPLLILGKHHRKYFYRGIALAILLLAMGALSLSKSLIFNVIFLVFLAMLLRGDSFRALFSLGFTAIGLFIVLTPLILLLRLAYAPESSTNSDQSIDVSAVGSLSDANQAAGFALGVQTWWVRLSYSNSQSFAIERFDNNLPGESISSIPWVLVPRLLFPEKPVIAAIGREYNALMDGNAEAAHAPTYVVEGYWNYGWPGTILVSLGLGLIFFAFRVYSDWLFAGGNFVFLPVWFSTLQIGIFQDGWLITNAVGVIFILLLIHFIINLGCRVSMRAAEVSGPRDV